MPRKKEKKERKKRRKLKREEVDKFKKRVQNRFFYILASVICSFFVVPMIIDQIEWGIQFHAFGYILDLDPFILYIVLALMFYIILRIAFELISKKYTVIA